MSRWYLLIALLVGPLIWTGCSMCCGPYDYEYPMLENTRYPRANPEFGRVGSILSDPSAAVGTPAKINADIPIEEEPLEDIDEDGLDDPDFDSESETLPDPSDLDEDEPTFDTDVDTSARLPRFPRFDSEWR